MQSLRCDTVLPVDPVLWKPVAQMNFRYFRYKQVMNDTARGAVGYLRT